MDKWFSINSIPSPPTTPATPATPARQPQRHAPPARPHSIAGFRGQHHHYHQQLLRSSSISYPAYARIHGLQRPQFLSRLPDLAIRRILLFLPPDRIPILASVSRRFWLLSKDDQLWKSKLDWLAYKGPLTSTRPQSAPLSHTHSAPANLTPAIQVSNPPNDDGDGFGDFVAATISSRPPQARPTIPTSKPPVTDPFDLRQLQSSLHRPRASSLIRQTPNPPSTDLFTVYHPPAKQDDLLLVLDTETDVGSSALHPLNPKTPPPWRSAPPSKALPPRTNRELFIQYFTSLIPYLQSLLIHSTSATLFTDPNLSLLERAQLISTISRLLRSPHLAPMRFYKNFSLLRNLQSATDVFEGSLLGDFERCDERHDELGMKATAQVVWALGEGTAGVGTSVVQVFVGKREIFYDTRFNPLDNLIRTETMDGQMGIDFRPMETYFRHVLQTIEREGSLIARIFPPEAAVLLFFIERIAVDVLSEYIMPLLSSAQSLPHPLFLLSTVAVYTQLRQVIETTVAIEPKNAKVGIQQVEEIIHRMFEGHLGDYLQEEAEWTKEVLERICVDWNTGAQQVGGAQSGLGAGMESVANGFLASSNPALMKKNVLSSFKSALMLPVSVVPKTVMYSFNAISSVSAGAFNTVANGLITPATGATSVGPSSTGYKDAMLLTEGAVLGNELESWLDDAEEVVDHHYQNEKGPRPADPFEEAPQAGDDGSEVPRTDGVQPTRTRANNRLRLFLSLDTSLKMIATDREALKRVESFQSFRGMYGTKVKDTLEEVFIVLLQSLGQKHIQVAFEKAFAQMSAVKSSKKGSPVGQKAQSAGTMAPLADFFELVHLADTIQQMVEVYFDREVAQHIDRFDFLNTAVREKRTFESNLDECVAKGLNVGLDLLMDQVEGLMIAHQSALDFCPPETDPRSPGSVREVGPTMACRSAIECLERHCGMVKGSTDKHVMEVFYQELGLRLHGILCKHLKRAIISIEGGVQVIADLNAYYEFIGTFNQNELNGYFTALKMVGGMFIVDSPKELGLLARDVNRFDGRFRAEDLYEVSWWFYFFWGKG